jgi:hypothetical protein
MGHDTTQNAKPDWQQYLEIYGTDLSLWPKEALSASNLEGVRNSDIYKNMKKLDHYMRDIEFPQMSDALSAGMIQSILDQKQSGYSDRGAMPMAYQSIDRGLYSPIFTTFMFLISLCMGLGFTSVIYDEAITAYHIAAGHAWYFGHI